MSIFDMIKQTLFGVILTFGVVSAHVSLTYPPARKYALDFLDSFRTHGSCGMAKPNGTQPTMIMNGGNLEVSWHLGYPHRGGYKISLLDPNDQEVQVFTNGFEGGNDKTSQSHSINLDSSLECVNCALKLERQALEWGKAYRFRSCADISIVKEENYRENCLGGGRADGRRCSCDRNRFGERCQFKNECTENNDCRNGGKCVDLRGTALPLKQCYCQPGFSGHDCSTRATGTKPISKEEFNTDTWKTNYKQAEGLKNGNVEFYYRSVENGDLLEGVIVGKNTLSYLAVGWRPKDATKACQQFPRDATPVKGSDFHAMDCVDYVIATVNDQGLARVGDYYSRDRSTPQPDSFYGGSDSIVDAVGWQKDGDTYVVFRKKAAAEDPSDHSFAGELHLVAAHGRSDDAFYRRGELKYHGGNRWKTSINSAPVNMAISNLLIILVLAISKIF